MMGDSAELSLHKLIRGNSNLFKLKRTRVMSRLLSLLPTQNFHMCLSKAIRQRQTSPSPPSSSSLESRASSSVLLSSSLSQTCDSSSSLTLPYFPSRSSSIFTHSRCLSAWWPCRIKSSRLASPLPTIMVNIEVPHLALEPSRPHSRSNSETTGTPQRLSRLYVT